MTPDKKEKKSKQEEKNKGERLPYYKDKRKTPATQEERANRYFDLREENGMLKMELNKHELEMKQYIFI